MFAQEQKYFKMKLTNNKILITDGGSGIGLELGKQLSAKGNKVIYLRQVGRETNCRERFLQTKRIFPV